MVDLKTKNQLDKIKIKRLKIILPVFILVFLSIIIFQYFNSKKIFVINQEANNSFTKLTIESDSGVIKPLLTGNTSDGGSYKLTANRASPLGPELKDIELETVDLEFYDNQLLLLKLKSNFAKYIASDNTALLFDSLLGKTIEGFSFTANSVSMNLDTSFIFLEGPIRGNGEGVLFETGKIEIHDNGEKIFFSSGVKFNIAPSSMKEEKN